MSLESVSIDPHPWHVAAEAALARRRVIKAERCLICEGIDSDTGRDCTSRGATDDGAQWGFDPGPFCKWALAEQVKRDHADAMARRCQHLTDAGMRDPAILDVVADPSRKPLPPPNAFADPREAEGVTMAIDSAVHFLKLPEFRTLVLSGGIGAGKSTSAAWVVAGSRGTALWLPATTINVPAAWNEVVGRAATVALLVVDDLGREHRSESGWSDEQLADLLCARIEGKPDHRTVVTTNLTASELSDRYGSRFASRMRREDSAFAAIGNIDLRARIQRARRAAGAQTFAERRDAR